MTSTVAEPIVQTDLASWLEVVDEIGPRFAERAAERDASDEFVADHYPILKERGLISALVPNDLGGGGASYSTMAAVLRRLAYHDASTALALSMHQHLVAAQVFNHLNGRPAPLLPRVANDKIVLVSTGARDWMESNGTVERVDGGYLVSARKAFDHPQEGPQVLHFGVPLSAEGVSLEDDWYVHGMRATGSRTIIFDKVFVPEATISLTRPRGGFAPIFQTVLAVAMPFITGVYVGVAERAAEIGLDLARKRASDPTVQFSVGEMLSALKIAQTCHDTMVARANNFEFTPGMANSNEVLMLKTHAVEQAKRTVQCAMEASGGAGFYRQNGLERLLRDVQAGHYHPLPEKQQMLLSGRLGLGLDPL
ncbi:MAG TPA: acyl-CoA dehydrogenase family protein [Tepidiformaceae bacterium]|nr:acyl-CoA dehydrogenase family protein [Tepidiformaceae bacterium]